MKKCTDTYWKIWPRMTDYRIMTSSNQCWLKWRHKSVISRPWPNFLVSICTFFHADYDAKFRSELFFTVLEKSRKNLLQHSNHAFYLPLRLFSLGLSIFIISLIAPIIPLSSSISVLPFAIFSVFFNLFHQNFTLSTITPSSVVLTPWFFRFWLCSALFLVRKFFDDF